MPNQLNRRPRPRGSVGPGRPRNTSREEIAGIALMLFSERGFDQTTVDDIAAAVGVSRRTILRYFDSKSDIAWGTFTEQLDRLRRMLADADPTEPIMDTLRRAIVAFNDYGETELPALRRRMTLITTVPALQGYSMLRYAEWCTVIAEFVAQRLGVDPADQIPQVIANAALGTSMATYRHWIQSGDHDLLESLDLALRLLAVGFSDDALR